MNLGEMLLELDMRENIKRNRLKSQRERRMRTCGRSFSRERERSSCGWFVRGDPICSRGERDQRGPISERKHGLTFSPGGISLCLLLGIVTKKFGFWSPAYGLLGIKKTYDLIRKKNLKNIWSTRDQYLEICCRWRDLLSSQINKCL